MPRRRPKGPGPRRIAIEGPIAAGKTALARHLAEALGGRAAFEEVEHNPFLRPFYLDPRRYAFQAQMFFLLSRYQQQLGLVQEDLFQKTTIVDYLFEKDRLFAALVLDESELLLYDRIYRLLEARLPPPDLVVHLTARPEVLMERIRARNRVVERPMRYGYLEELVRAHNEFFRDYSKAPVLKIDASEVELEDNEPELDRIVQTIRTLS